MIVAKHAPTPGPWVFESYLEDEGSGTFQLHRVMTVRSRQTIVDEVPEAADAALIAAAPDLLEAIKPLLQYASDVDRSGLTPGFQREIAAWIKAGAAAVAKAEGRT